MKPNTEKKLNKIQSGRLEVDHISVSSRQALEYIDGRRRGAIKSLKSGFSKLDNSLLGGIEWNRIFTIAAMSGSGKSVFLEQLKRQVLQLNDPEELDILSFEFEMPSREQVIRNLSAMMEIPVGDLLSASTSLTEERYEEVREAAKELAKLPIYSVESTGTVDQMFATILNHIEKSKKKKLIITVDHVLLTTGKQGEEERKIIAQLYRAAVNLKKLCIKRGFDILFLFLSQLNRAIETPERVLNADLHYPTRSDLFGSSDIFMCSDYVLVIHKPAILGLDHYGKSNKTFKKGLPIQNPKDPAQAMIYFHLLKQRTGTPKVLMMVDKFQFSKIEEF